MRRRDAFICAIVAVFSSFSTYAEEAFVPEQFTVKAKIDAGPNVFVIDQSWTGASRINVLSENNFTPKGNISMGLNAQFVLSRDHKTAYTMSAFPKRILSGPIEAVLQEFDVSGLTLKREIAISPKMVLSSPQINYLQLSADENYAYVQNATPATSVTVVDLKAGKMLVEVPTPGCFGIFPAMQGSRFSSLCGDGTIATYSFKEDGSLIKPVKSAKIFDADVDPLFIQGIRAAKDLLFASFNGSLYRVSDATDTVRLIDKFSYTEGVEGKWAPGGVAVMAHNAANNVLFVNMRPNANDGSHKSPGKEVWAINLNTKKVLNRAAIEEGSTLAVTQGAKPVLFVLDDQKPQLSRFDVEPASNFSTKFSRSMLLKGDYTQLVWVDD